MTSVRSLAVQRAAQNGGTDIGVVIEKNEEILPLDGRWGDPMLMEMLVAATAVGRPFPA
jgi:hypothetical protein